MVARSIRRSGGVMALSIALAASGVALSQVANADSQDIAAVTARVSELEERSQAASERAGAVRSDLRQAQAQLDDLNLRLDQARAHLSSQQGALGQLARQLYVSGGQPNASMLITADDPQAFLAGLDRLQEAGQAQSTVLDRARAAADDVARAQGEVDRQRNELVDLVDRLDQERSAATAAVEQARSQLAVLQEAERKRVAEAVAAAREAERRAAEEAAARAQAQAAAEAAAKQQAAQAAAAQAATDRAAIAQSQAAQAAQDEAAQAAQDEAAQQAAAAALRALAEQQSSPIALPKADPPPAPAESAAPQSSSADPSFAESAAWAQTPRAAAIRHCESTDNYSINTGNGYYGAWQFDHPSWLANGGGQFAEYPHQATRAQQDFVAWTYWRSSGWGPWQCAGMVP